METRLIRDFGDRGFQESFKLYFQELGIDVRDWAGLFREMDSDGRGNKAWLRTEVGRTAGFLQFCEMEFTGWFMTKTLGFVREFWIAPEYRGQGHGSELLGLTEEYLKERGAAGVVLTTDTAPGFYERRGYRHDPGFKAKNGEPVYIKHLIQQ